jgi:hypothetical protein
MGATVHFTGLSPANKSVAMSHLILNADSNFTGLRQKTVSANLIRNVPSGINFA